LASRRSPGSVPWFADAASLGLGAELELAAVLAALAQLEDLEPAWRLAVNLSPSTMCRPEFRELVQHVPLRRLAFELTEHQQVADYAGLNDVLTELRSRGALLAVDDAGAGFASLRHILKLTPDVIKLDMALTRAVDTDPVKRALAAALVRFARDIGAAITAEGIETEAELATLRELGITYGQGFFLAHPAPLPPARTGRAYAPA
jgi:EAL domain-containing protein (putative c-di-GMP-specific phosphodiesterase class I)